MSPSTSSATNLGSNSKKITTNSPVAQEEVSNWPTLDDEPGEPPSVTSNSLSAVKKTAPAPDAEADVRPTSIVGKKKSNLLIR